MIRGPPWRRNRTGQAGRLRAGRQEELVAMSDETMMWDEVGPWPHHPMGAMLARIGRYSFNVTRASFTESRTLFAGKNPAMLCQRISA
jgi:hypothetical protein